MNKSSLWWIRYILVIAVTLILGAALGELNFFKQSGLDFLRLSAANLIRFIGYGSALVLLWLLAQRAATELRGQGGWKQPASYFVLPLATVIIVPASHPVLLLVVGGLLGPNSGRLYDWLFILGTTAAAVWLVIALFQHLEQMFEKLRSSESQA